MNRFERRLQPFRFLARGLLQDPARLGRMLKQAMTKLDGAHASAALQRGAR